jgi:hypothetical protein
VIPSINSLNSTSSRSDHLHGQLSSFPSHLYGFHLIRLCVYILDCFREMLIVSSNIQASKVAGGDRNDSERLL